MMRVIAGIYRHRKLVAPPGLDTRPILDRVKTSLFDWLGSRLAVPGQLPPLHVLDLFCGGGSLGIEALSRGVRTCLFVEANSLAISCLRENLRTLGIHDEARIIDGYVESAVINTHDPFALIFLDPPYSLSEDLDRGATMDRVLRRFECDIPTTRDALLLWRHDAQTSLPETLPGAWRCGERRAWGNMAITLFQHTAKDDP